MNTSRNWIFSLAVAGLCAFTGMTQAQNAEPAPAPPPPPVSVEAPDAPAVETPTADTPSIEASDDKKWRRRNHDNDRVVVGGNATLDEGQQANSVVSVLGNSTSAGEVFDAVVSVIGDTRVTAGTAEDVVAVLGNVYLNGKARGDVVATLGDVELGPNAEVGGNVIVVGGTLKRDPAAIIHGGVQNVLSFAAGTFDWLRPWARHCLLLGRPLAIASGLGWAWGLALGFLGLYTLIALLFRPAVDRCVQTLTDQPGKSIVAALLTTLLTPVMFALLFITIIGIAFVPIAALGVFLVGLFGKAVVLAWIGRSVFRLSGEGSAGLHTALAVILGGLIVTLLYLVPFVGFIVWKALGILGLGVAVFALIQSMKRRGENGPAVAMAGTPGGGASATFSEPTMGDAYPSESGRAEGFQARWSHDPGAPADDASGAPKPNPYGAAGTVGSADTAGSTGAPGTFGATGASAFGPGDATSASGAGHTYGRSESTSSSGASGTTSSPGSSSSGGQSSGAGGIGGSSGGGTGGGSGRSGGAGPSYGPSDPHNTATALTYPRAGFGVRMAALFIDVILIAVLLGIVDSTREAELIALATYGAIMWKLKSTTIGGIVFGLQVVRVDGRPIDWATATVRALSCFLSLVVAGLGFIWIAFDEGNQAWHDKIAGTAVVRVPKGVSLL